VICQNCERWSNLCAMVVVEVHGTVQERKLLLLLLLLFCFTVSSTEGLTATCAAAFELS